MRRELKDTDQSNTWSTGDRRRTFPDEEGTERVDGEGKGSLIGKSRRTFPDEEGTESVMIICWLLCSGIGRRTFPDEEGTESYQRGDTYI